MKFIIVFSSLMILLQGCTTTDVDYSKTFHIKGIVIDQTTNLPIENVAIYFVDTGFDEVRSRTPVPKLIGKTSHSGGIDITFEYWWGRRVGSFSKHPTNTFEVRISKTDYKSQLFQFQATDTVLNDRTKAVEVDLNRIYLSPNQMNYHPNNIERR